MYKKNLIFTTIILIVCIIVGQFLKGSFVDMGLIREKELSNIDNIEFKIFKLLNKEEYLDGLIKYKDQYIQKVGEDCEYIAIVKPTGHINFYISGATQEVSVIEVLKGNPSLKQKNIQLQGLPGFEWIDASENSSYLEFDAVKSYMQPEYEYLIFFNNLNKASNIPEESGLDLYDYLENELIFNLDNIVFFSYLKLNNTQEIILEEKNTYSYKEVKNIEIFTNSFEYLEVWNEIKEAIIRKYIS